MKYPTRSIGFAVGRLRASIVACCWIIGLSLIVQIVVWSLASFTDLRYEMIEPDIESALVVNQDDLSRQYTRSATSTAVSFRDTLEPVQVTTMADRFLRDAQTLSTAIGTLATLVLVPMVLLGVLLAANQESDGIDRTFSAFIWSVILAALALPFGNALELPWQDGAFRPYALVASEVDAYRNGQGGWAMYFGKYLMLPIACGVGVMIAGWRFSRGVQMIVPPETRFLDPELEREAANVRATSLHGSGGRQAGALSRVIRDDEDKPAARSEDRLPTARAVSVGDAPRRLI